MWETMTTTNTPSTKSSLDVNHRKNTKHIAKALFMWLRFKLHQTNFMNISEIVERCWKQKTCCKTWLTMQITYFQKTATEFEINSGSGHYSSVWTIGKQTWRHVNIYDGLSPVLTWKTTPYWENLLPMVCEVFEHPKVFSSIRIFFQRASDVFWAPGFLDTHSLRNPRWGDVRFITTWCPKTHGSSWEPGTSFAEKKNVSCYICTTRSTDTKSNLRFATV